MTISTTDNREEYTGNGVTTAFSFPNYFLEEADLKVYQNGTLKTLTTHYTITGEGNPAGGTVTFLVAPANDDAIIILRDPPLTQTADYVANDPFPAETHEEALDKLTMITQRLKDRMDRAAVLPDTVASTVSPVLPTPSAGKAILWNEDAEGLENSTDDFNDIVTDATAQATAAAASAAAASASATAAATAETNAETAETNAEIAEANAEAAAAAAQAAADSIGFRDVIFITSADSPYSVVQATSGKLLSVDTSSGAVTVTLPQISTLTLPFTVGVKKATGDANAVTINRAGTDTFDDGATSKTLSGIAGTTLIPDTDPAPDKWTASDWGAASGQQKKQQFVDGVGFTAGVSTTITITETPLPSTDDALEIFFDGAYQQESEWSYVAATGVVTFGSAIPGGTSKIETVWATPLTIGTPADGSVSTAKLASTLISAATAETSPATDDLLLLSDTSAGALDKITLENLLKVINSLTEDTSPDANADFLVTYDASASGAKKTLLRRLTSGTAVATTSGTSIDFTSIPSWVKRITVMLSGVSTNGTSIPLIQIGDSGGVETTNYTGAVATIQGGSAQATFSSGFALETTGLATNTLYGSLTLSLMDSASNLWAISGSLGFGNVGRVLVLGGTKALSATLDRVRLTTVGGTETFDAGSVNILYE